MKKTLLLAGAALLALAACNKTQTVETNLTEGELITFKAMTSLPTKANPEFTGTTLAPTATEADNKQVRMYACATTYNAQGGVENTSFFKNKRFAYNATNANWLPVSDVTSAGATTESKIYWPIGGGSVDFLAYAYYLGTADDASNDVGTSPFDVAKVNSSTATNVADELVFASIDLYTNNLDLMYAAANAQKGNTSSTSGYKTVPMVFQHAGAVIDLDITSNVALTITDIKFAKLVAEGATFAENKYATLDKEGTLTVDNSRNTLTATWSDVDQGTTATYGSGLTAFTNWNSQSLTASTLKSVDNVIIMPQPKLNFIITMVVDGQNYIITANVPKGSWLAGHKYVYKITLTFSAIEVNATVQEYVHGNGVSGENWSIE